MLITTKVYLTLAAALINAAPPPITIPSSTAALVALKASLNPKFSFEDFSTSFATTPSSYPAFKAICFNGALIALKTIAAPICSSPQGLI